MNLSSSSSGLTLAISHNFLKRSAVINRILSSIIPKFSSNLTFRLYLSIFVFLFLLIYLNCLLSHVYFISQGILVDTRRQFFTFYFLQLLLLLLFFCRKMFDIFLPLLLFYFGKCQLFLKFQLFNPVLLHNPLQFLNFLQILLLFSIALNQSLFQFLILTFSRL